MYKIGNEGFYCFSITSIIFGFTFISAGLGAAAANYTLYGIFGGTVGNALLGTGGALIAAGLIGMGIPKFQAIILKKDDETLRATVAKNVDNFYNNKL